MTQRRALTLSLLLASHTLPVHAQRPANPASPTPTLNANSSLVVVPTLVRNHAGNLVFTLNASDFVLTDNGVPQKLTLEQGTGGEPLALVVLIQAGAASKSSAWYPKLRGSRHADPLLTVPTMIEAMVGNVPRRIAVVGFDSGPELLHDFTANMDAAANAIYDLDTNMDGDGGAAILDALGFSLDLLRQQPPEYRRAILLLSEVHDRGSHIKLEEALRAISDTNTSIYSFSFSSDDDQDQQLPTKKIAPQADDELIRFENPNPGPAHGCFSRDPNDPNVNLSKSAVAQDINCIGLLLPPVAIAEGAYIAARDGLQKNIPETVARVTGGEYFKPSSEKALERDLQVISNHIPNRYLLSFQPQSPHPGFHSIELKAPAHAGLDISARSGYWADTPAKPAP
jgi:VWFA-related protein